MPKYRVFASVTATLEIGVFDADSEKEALVKAIESDKYRTPRLCNKCAEIYEIEDIAELFADVTEE